jgi:hypothetical protein
MVDYSAIVAIIGMLSFVFGAFNYVVIRPLNTAIKTLQLAIDEMRRENKEREDKRQLLDVRMSVAEDSLKQAHKRLDHLEERVEG